ncbi:ABC transporter permease [Streptomyces sp. NPDC048340]|uniref:ABC transporter permease n=1 Tax=Streptomyces sp. NPDC048340 TaxID=3365537 RepID=UPI00372452EA
MTAAPNTTGRAAVPAERPDPAVYTSSVPATRPHLGHAMASEWTKLTSVRSTVGTLASLVVIIVGIGILFITQTRSDNYVQMPFTAPALFGLLVGQLSVMALGVLMMSSEYGTGLVRTTFTAAPDRYRVLTAKYLVFGITTFLATAGSVYLVGLAAMLVHGGTAAGPHPGSAWLYALLGSFYVTLLGVLAVAVGALVRHSAGAVAVMLGVVTLPPLIGGILGVWEASAGVGRVLLEYNAPVALMQVFDMPDVNTGPTSLFGLPGNATHLAVILLATGAAVAGSYVVTGRRDV